MLIGVISDAHGDIYSFAKVIEILRKSQVDRIYHIGDLIGYVPSLKILDEIPKLGGNIEFLLGNHEDAILSRKFDYRNEPVYKHEFLFSQLTEANIAFLKSFAKELVLTCGKNRVHMSHGGPGNPVHGYTYKDSQLPIEFNRYKYVFCGNTHRAFSAISNSTSIVNVGSCAFPRDKGDKGSYALFNSKTGEIHLKRFDLEPLESRFDKDLLDEIHISVKNLYQRGR